MHQYYYELQIFEDLISGELEPLKLKGEKLKLGRTFLSEEIGECQEMKLLKLRIKNSDIEVLEKLHITNAHPLAGNYFNEPDIQFEENLDDIFADNIVNELGLDLDNVSFTISKAKNNIRQIGICQNTSWNEIEQQRLKYCYYHQLLSDCQRKIKKLINVAVFDLKSFEFTKLIVNIQKSLIYYLNELKKKHKIDPHRINYQLKDYYTNQDCISLVYMSLIEMLNHLYENYDAEFDKSYPVPFYSETINVNQIDEKIKYILKSLKAHNVDPLLTNVLNEQFERIVAFNHPNRLTYHELDYFIEFLTSLFNFLVSYKNIGITADSIVYTLISCRFNNYKFIQYLTNEIRMDLETISTLQEKRLYLLKQKKLIEQCIKAIKTPFDPETNDVSEILCDWIDKEIALVDEQILHYSNSTEVQKTETYKIETALTSKELAVFFKTMSDGDIVVSKSQSEIARWISANFKTSTSESISISQSRNNLYNSDPRTIEKVKQVCIEMVNILNERLSAKD